MALRQDARPNLIVFGIGHSGTTILTRLLFSLGWNAARDTDAEYSEPVSIRAANIEALRTGRLPAESGALVARIDEPWAIKDPRFVRTLPLWTPLLVEWKPTLLWLTRDLNRVKRSYVSRGELTNGVPAAHGLSVDGLWLAAQENFTRWPGPKLQLSYEQIASAIAKFVPSN